MLRGIFTIFIIGCLVLSIQAQDIDIFTPKMISIKENYIEQKTKIEDAKQTELNNLIDSCLLQAEKQEKEQKNRGNTSGIAAAKKLSRTLNKYKKDLEEKEDFEISTRSRPETKAISGRIAKEKAIIDSKYQEVEIESLQQAQDLFKNAMMEQENLTDFSQAKVETEFAKLTESKTVKQKTNVDSTTNTVSNQASVDSMFANYIAQQKSDVIQSGKTEHWQSFASIKGAVNSIAMFDIPLAEISETKVFEGMQEGNAYKLEYIPLDKLDTANQPFFMIKNLNTADKFDIINWPSKKNNWTLSIRLRPGHKFPSNHRLELMIGGDFLAIQQPQEQKQVAQLKNVKIQIKSVPDKAYVYINDQPIKVAGRFTVTPCIITIPAGTQKLTIKKSGYKPKTIADFTPEHKKSYTYVLLKSKNNNESTIKLDAKDDWKSSKLSVNKGDTVFIQTKGKWSVGKDQEKIDYKGYPNNSTYFKYYIEDKYHPSVNMHSNYGAIIAKIGKKGKTFTIKADKPFTVQAGGIIYYTVNESATSKSDNSGSIYVKTQINLKK
jgi:hypothetical protein